MRIIYLIKYIICISAERSYLFGANSTRIKNYGDLIEGMSTIFVVVDTEISVLFWKLTKCVSEWALLYFNNRIVLEKEILALLLNHFHFSFVCRIIHIDAELA